MNPIYANNAAGSWPLAPGVAEAVYEAMRQPAWQPGRDARGESNVVENCRARLAALLGVKDPARVVFTPNASFALNLAILGLSLSDGDRVVTTVTEHNSVLRPLHLLEKEKGVRLTLIGLDSTGRLDMDAFDDALRQGPSLVVCNHASNVTGRVNDVAAIFSRAKARGAATLLDASQSLGYLPVSPSALHADLIAFPGQKGLRGPVGTGALYISPEIKLRQIWMGGTGIRSDVRLHPEPMPLRHEMGTVNVPALAGLAAALAWREEHGGDFREHARRVTREFRDRLREIPGVHIFDDDDACPRVNVVSFRLAEWSVEEAGYVLAESFQIFCRTGLHCAPRIHSHIGSAPDGTVRMSFSGCTTESDVETILSAIKELATCRLCA
ncbi:MAG: aminotransferase class V-fold PLP-dependent enzyme [Phycisphaerae bacterium]|nr:aminotransferase class V-fold PLP-dependent enzyme [Phycisphaerae bacterium]